MKKKKWIYLMLATAMLLLLGSTVGSTRAALTYYSENYVAEISTVTQIGVSLLENGEVVSSRDYNKNKWKVTTNKGAGSTSGELLSNMLKSGENLALNKKYDEKLTVKNSGEIDEYVRVRIYRYWMQNGKKLTTLSPDLIDLNFANTDRWIKNPNGTAECVELFYKGILPAGQETKSFADTIRIDGQLAAEAYIEKNDKTITTTYKYEGVEFHVDVEVDAVQTHNAQDAIKSAWGVDASSLGIL